jgi:hypothetical protein
MPKQAKAECVHGQGRYEGVVKIKVHRAILADKDPFGIGTFPPKDEKTEYEDIVTNKVRWTTTRMH